jgi:GNAT superfamily N-acetyltransferase
VAEERRGEGLGRLLLSEIVRRLLGMGLGDLDVETACWNLPALSLYQDLGLKPRPPLMALHLAQPGTGAPWTAGHGGGQG